MRINKQFPNYCIYKDGRIRNRSLDRDIKMSRTQYGYRVKMTNKQGVSRYYRVATILLMTYGPEPQSEKHNRVQFKDGNVLNHSLDNLAWITPKELANASEFWSTRKRPVLCIETGVVYESVCSAARAMFLSGHQLITRACCDPAATSAGYHWTYVEDGSRTKQITCINNGVTYKSSYEAAKKLSLLSPSKILECAKGTRFTYKGLKFKLAEEV